MIRRLIINTKLTVIDPKFTIMRSWKSEVVSFCLNKDISLSQLIVKFLSSYNLRHRGSLDKLTLSSWCRTWKYKAPTLTTIKFYTPYLLSFVILETMEVRNRGDRSHHETVTLYVSDKTDHDPFFALTDQSPPVGFRVTLSWDVN